MTVALALATLTLTAGGAALYAVGLAGWAQLLWVLASGTAGGLVVALVDRR